MWEILLSKRKYLASRDSDLGAVFLSHNSPVNSPNQENWGGGDFSRENIDPYHQPGTVQIDVHRLQPLLARAAGNCSP